MTRFGLDSTGMVSPAAHHAVGSTVALRYLSRFTSKVITRPEHEAYKANGIDLCLVFEDAADNALRGHSQGVADAQFALNQAVAILGHPLAEPCITFAVDTDPSGGVAATTDSYFDGVASVIPRDRCGPYGGYDMVARAHARGFKYLWQTYAWSQGKFFPGSQLYQYSNGHGVGGQDTDFDHIFPDATGFFGQWDRHPAPPPDPHHYLWFPVGPFNWGSYKHLNERAIVERYDVLRAMQTPHRHPHRAEAEALKKQLRALADRVWFVAHHDLNPAPASWGRPTPSWSKFNRGWRYQQLAKRSTGARLV